MNPAGPDREIKAVSQVGSGVGSDVGSDVGIDVVRHVVTDFRLAQARESRLAWYLAGAYLLVIVYASLSPFSGWATPGIPALTYLGEPWPQRWHRFDLLVNCLAYLPLGLLLTLAAMRWMRPVLAVLLATTVASILSFAMETTQMYLPHRVATTIDLTLNIIGALAGALVAARTGRMPLWAHIRDIRRRWCLPGRIAEPGLALLALWLLTQLDPSLPLLSVRALPDAQPIPGTGFMPPRDFSELAAVAVAINTLGISLFVTALMRRRWHALVATGSLLAFATAIKLAAAAAMLKPQAAFIWLSDEVLVGLGAGVAVSVLTLALPRQAVIAAGMFALLCSFVAIHLFPNPLAPAFALWPFRWNYGQLLNYTGLSRTVAEFWPLIGAGYLFSLSVSLRDGRRHGLSGRPRSL